MATGTTLAKLRKMLNAELGNVLDEAIAPGGVDIDSQILNNQQAWLGAMHAFLLRKARAEVSLAIGQQYYDFPDTALDISQVDKPAFVRYGNVFRYRLEFGIGQEEYNAFDSARGIVGSPVRRWDLVDVSGSRKIEVWPVPSSVQTLMLSGQIPVPVMKQDNDVCVIDDLVLVLFTAAEKLARTGSADAQAKLSKATALLNSLKAAAPSQYETINLSGGGRHFQETTKRPVVGVTLATLP